jgi:SSS family solute:Na+ symporter
MALLLITAVFFVFAGGQVAVLITDFIQGAFANVVFLLVVVYLLHLIGWDAVGQVLTQVEPGHSKINPFDTGYVADFNFMYFFIGMIGLFYGAMSWQGTQAYYTSARTAHEGKMGGVLETWRLRTQEVFMFVVPILVFTVMHHQGWTGFAGGIEDRLTDIDNPAVRNQMRGPLVLAALLPKGLLGAFAALMLGAFISTHNTYLHSWSSIFIQDVVLPFRKTPLSSTAHLRLLRGGVVGVALFIFFFSLFYQQSQAILLFFALTGAIFAGWSGAVIIGGLYTRWGTTLAAWAATVSGVTLALTGFVLEQAQRSWRDTGVVFWGLLDGVGNEQAALWAAWVETHLPNGQQMWGWSMWVCSVIYVVVSLVEQRWRPGRFDLDRLLHRGRFALEGETESGTPGPANRGRILGITAEFGRRDRFLYFLTWGWNLAWVLVFAVGTIFFLTRRLEAGQWTGYDTAWLTFWKSKIWIEIGVGCVVVVWFTWGGIRDLRRMLRDLGTREVDDRDDGVVNEAGQE